VYNIKYKRLCDVESQRLSEQAQGVILFSVL